MAALRNQLARAVLCLGMRLLGALVQRKVRRRLSTWADDQSALRRRLGVGSDAPLRRYDDALRAAVRAVPGAVLVKTSGSTDRPKEIAYTPARLASVKRSFAGATLRSVDGIGARRPIIFTLASLGEDDSFTGLMTGGTLSWLDCWVTPHRILSDSVLAPLVAQYGVNAARVWALVLSKPGWLYSTNPSTQAVFFHALQSAWEPSLAMLRAFVEHPESFGAEVQGLARRIVVPGWRARAERLLSARSPLPPQEWLELEAHCSWDGGNTGAFLAQVRAELPGVSFVPMFSMSTETLETLPVYVDGHPRFLPICPDVLYEFLPADADPTPGSLVGVEALEDGALYELIVSDPHGLCRYRTEDLFRVTGFVEGVPDLRFAHRTGLAYSFTGEKLTGRQLALVFERLVARYPDLRTVQLCWIPSRAADARLPSYVLGLCTGGAVLPEGLPSPDTLAEEADALLRAINDEYGGKRSSERLADPVGRAVDYDVIAAVLKGGSGRNWDSQFKLLPLLRRTWQDLGL